MFILSGSSVICSVVGLHVFFFISCMLYNKDEGRWQNTVNCIKETRTYPRLHHTKTRDEIQEYTSLSHEAFSSYYKESLTIQTFPKWTEFSAVKFQINMNRKSYTEIVGSYNGKLSHWVRWEYWQENGFSSLGTSPVSRLNFVKFAFLPEKWNILPIGSAYKRVRREIHPIKALRNFVHN
jgi:hypothetical protein